MADRDSTGLALPIQGTAQRDSMASQDTAILTTATNGASSADPFSTPTQQPHQRFAQYDDQIFSASMSPSQARRTLEIHLAETERRIKEASKLGTSLVEQQASLTAQLTELQDKKEDGEIGEDVRQKLANIEKEYNELGRDSARAFLAPRSRLASSETPGADAASPAMFSSQATNSPSKLTVPSRKQRNQPSSRANDIEFAAEIGTSLLSQVKQLQALLAEREDALKTANIEKSRLEVEAKGLTQRLRNMDESEQRYKDENWNLETRTHELMAAASDSTEREEKLSNSLKALTNEKTGLQKELDELKQSHGKLTDEHTTITKHHEAEISGLRRNIVFADNEKTTLQRKLDEMNSRNEELAKAAALSRSKPEHFEDIKDLERLDGDTFPEVLTPDGSPPPSPTKGTPRHTGLESETLKTSLQHSHGMIQTLKKNLHRERSEKLELKRMLQETKDELEIRRGQNGAAGAANTKTKRSGSEKELFKKPAKPGMLGASRSGTREVLIDEEDWEDHAGEQSPTRAPRKTITSPEASHETSDAFETANEKGDTTTENEAFETGVESLAGESSDDLTETEDPVKKASKSKDQKSSRLNLARNRESYLSTASTSNDEHEAPEKGVKAPFLQRLKLKVNRGGSIRHQRAANDSASLTSTPPSMKNSPASIANSSPAGPPGQSLFAELGDFEGELDEDGTPSKRSILSHGSRPSTATRTRPSTLVAPPLPEMKDSGMMTEPFQSPEPPSKTSNGAAIAAVGAGAAAVGGALAAAAVGSSGEKSDPSSGKAAVVTPPHPDSPTIPDSDEPNPIVLSTSKSPFSPSSAVGKKSTPEKKKQQSLVVSEIHSEAIEPITPKQLSPISAHPVPAGTDKEISSDSQQQDAAKPGLLGSMFGWGSKQPTEDSGNNAKEASNQDPSNGKTPAVAIVDQSSQTTLSSSQIDELLKSRSTTGVPLVLPLDVNKAQQNPQWRLSTGELQPESLRPRKSQESIGGGSVSRARSKLAEANMARDEGSTLKTHKRPSSSSSQRSSTGPHPPLPPDHRQAIAAAAQKTGVAESSQGVMGPPGLPASAYRSTSQGRPRTPSSQYGGQGPTSPTGKGHLQARGSARVYSSRNSEAGTRRSSVTSFASELDERFNIRADGLPMSHAGFGPNTDPRMIQAITQTMIGEYLWKYTRRAGRGEMSANRHRRFFWIHPYTRTLYWSDRDPASAGRAQLKAKSVSIEAVRVVTDDNPMPPGLHRKSLVVLTPGREVKFTATTGQRHETWFNALSYLLIRTGPNGTVGAGDYTAEELDEFNPSLLPRGRGTSIRSYASRNTRYSDAPTTSGTVRQSTQLRNTDKSAQPGQQQSAQGSISRLSNYFVPSSIRGSFSSRRSRHSQGGAGKEGVYESSELHDSAEDVREIIERGEGDGLENVRACCDGKHDVGHLSSRRSRTSGISEHHHHHHHHSTQSGTHADQ